MLLARLRRVDPYLILLLLLATYGFALRLYDLGHQSLWHDAGYSVNAALSVLDRGLPILPSGHFYSPGLLNTLLTAASMGLFGETEFAARLPSVLFGTLTIPLVFLFARSIGDKRVALIGAFLVTFSVLEIAWSREARMYQQLQFFYVLSLYFFYHFTQRRTNACLALTIVSTICTVLTHALGFSLILIFFAYPLLANVRNIRRYVSRQFLLSGQTVFLLLCAVAVLVTGEFLLGLFSAVWNTRVNYFAEYWLLLNEALPVVLYLSLVGAMISLRDSVRPSLLLILAMLVPAYFVFFHVQLLGFRYLYLLIPVMFVLFACAVTYISRLLPSGRLKPVAGPLLTVLILGLTVGTPAFNFVPRSIYYLEPTASQPDFKRAYSFVRESMSEGDIVIDTWPALGRFYLKQPPDHWLAFDIAGTGVAYCAGDGESREMYTNAPCIEDLERLQAVVMASPGGWLVIDGLAEFRLPQSYIRFIEQDLTYYDEGSSRGRGGVVKVYGWEH